MRYWIGFVVAAAAVPAAGVAQNNEESVDEPEAAASRLERWYPEAFEAPRPKEVPPGPPMSSEGKKVRNAKIGLGVSAVVVVAGVVMATVAAGPVIDFSGGSSSDSGGDAVIWAGTAVAAAGGASMIATGIMLGTRKRELRESKEATRRKVHWDLARPGLVF
jgi:hypothetical protein